MRIRNPIALEPFRFSSNREKLHPFVLTQFRTENHYALFLELLLADLAGQLPIAGRNDTTPTWNITPMAPVNLS